MSRLDRHVALVQGKLTVERFLLALGYSLAAFCTVVVVGLLVNRLAWVAPPKPWVWIWSALGASVLAAIVYSMVRKTSAHQAATFIDEKLGLNEKFSTALYARKVAGNHDAFAVAAIKDAERTAENVSLNKRFPIGFPKSSKYAAVAAALMVGAYYVPYTDLFDRQPKLEALKKHEAEKNEARKQLQNAVAMVASQPKSVQAKQAVQTAQLEAKQMLEQKTIDPVEAKLTAQKAQEEAEQAKQEEIKNNVQYAEAQAEKAVFNPLNVSQDEKGAIADASRDIASGNFDKAAENVKSLAAKFDNMKQDEKKEAARQMDKLANDLKNIATDPAAMKNLQNKLQQAGATQQQAQQLAQTMQQAASGNQQAQQQLANMQQQVMKQVQQMNGGKGPTQQQVAQAQKAMSQMQSVAGAQQSAQQMAGAASAMAQAMQQQAGGQQGKAGSQQQGQATASAKAGGQQGSGQQPGGQQAGGQQASAQQPGGQKTAGQQPGGQQPGAQAGGAQASGQQSGQQAGQQGAQANGQQPGGSQPGGQQGNQPGSQPGGAQANAGQPGGQQGGQQPGGGQGKDGQGQQQMKDAGQQMADALDKMDAAKKDAEQQQMADAGGNGNGDSGQGDKPGGDQDGPGGQGPGKLGQPGAKGNGMGGPGMGNGGVGAKSMAQFTVKQEKAPVQNIANGRVLAKSFVKSKSEKGTSSIELSSAGKAAVQEATGEQAGEEIPKDAQKVVKDYFDTLGQQ